ncbi:MAG: IPT/TIG domain-containing protein [Blastocatellia bacterium]
MKPSLSRGSLVQVLALVAVALIYFGFPSQIAAQQGGTVRYFYDDNGRLIRVVLPSGETATYEYDAAGNFTAIKRFTNDVLQLLDFSPKVGGPGDSVTFFGSGFGSAVNQVSFNGATGRLISADATTVIAEVPEGATTGPVTITTSRGSVTTSVPFTIKSIRVQPSSANIAPGASLQFTADVRVLGDSSIKWSINGVDGGNAAVGTITATDLYTAPSLPPFPIIVRATSVIDPLLFGEAQVTVRSLDFDLAFQSSAVSVARQSAPASPDNSAAMSAGVSVQRESTPDAMLPIAAVSGGLSVGRGDNLDTTTTISAISLGVSIQRDPLQSPAPDLAAISASVSATKGPLIAGVSPNLISRGGSMSVTITGANLTGTATVKFIDSAGAIDTNIVVSSLVVNADGTTLTMTLNASASAVLGRHLVIISTPGGNSALIETGSNTIDITP